MVRDSGKPPVRGKTSPYGFFVKMCYEEHKKKYPNENVQVTEISKKCSEKWKTMTDDEKRRFYELAQKDAERYQAEVAAYGGEEAMRKRKRAKKDPNAPKRALSAFFFFSSQKRPEVQAQNPDWKVGQVAQELGRRWKDLSEEEKKAFEEMAVRDKTRYEQEMRDYKETGKKPASRMETNAAAMAGVGLPSGSAHLSVPMGADPAAIAAAAHLLQPAAAAAAPQTSAAGQPQQLTPVSQQQAPGGLMADPAAASQAVPGGLQPPAPAVTAPAPAPQPAQSVQPPPAQTQEAQPGMMGTETGEEHAGEEDDDDDDGDE